MNYEKNYYDYINYIKTKDRKLEYSEIHHIIPKCLGGTNDETNLVRLTAREHFLAHYLLTKIYPNNLKLIDAFRMMGVINKKDQKRYINSRLYESKKKLFAKARSKQVVCIETGEVFPSASYVEKNIISGVRDVIYGKQLTAGGFHWKYLNEEPKIKKPFQKKKVICANTGEIFDSVELASKSINVSSMLIRSICNGNKKGNAKGLTFYYYEGEKDYPIKEINSCRKVKCIETGEVFNSIKEASKNKSDEANICKCCKGLKKSHKGLHWEYVDYPVINYSSEEERKEGEVKKIKCIETGEVFKTAIEAGKQFNSTSAARYIRKCCKGLMKTYKKFHWAFVDN